MHRGLVASVDSAGVVVGSEISTETGGRIAVARLTIVEPAGLLVEGEVPSSSVTHSFVGPVSRWRSNLRWFERVHLKAPDTGVQFEVTPTPAGVTIRIALPRGNCLSRLAFLLEAADQPRPFQGNVLVATSCGDLRLEAHAPSLSSEERRSVGIDVSASDSLLRLTLPEGIQPEQPLTVELGLEWSTLLGGSGADGIDALTIGPDGSVTVTGTTSSFDFPTTPGTYDASYAGGTGSSIGDIFVARLAPGGDKLLWSTYLGGSKSELPAGVLVSGDGAVTVAGQTFSLDFPTSPGAFRSVNELGEGFVTTLDSSGSSILSSTFLGGSKGDWITGLARGAAGAAIVVGTTSSTDFPVTATAMQPTGGAAPGDAFLASVSADGASVGYASYLGGSSGETAAAVAVDPDGVAFVAGSTSSSDFPTTQDAFDTSYEGIQGHAFVTAINLSAGNLVASTLFGGPELDSATSVGFSPGGGVILLGYTYGIPVTPNALDPTWNGFEDGFVARFDHSLETLEYATHVGGSRRDFPYSLKVETSGGVVIAGNTDSEDFPTTPGAFQETKPGPAIDRDLFVLRLGPDGALVHYATYLGGTGTDGFDSMGLDVDAVGAAVLGAFTQSDDFPTTPGSYDPAKAPGTPADSTVSKLNLLPAGVKVVGQGSGGCVGSPTLSVRGMPALGSTKFALTAWNAPSTAPGLLALGLEGLSRPVAAGGADVWLSTAALIGIAGLVTNSAGYCELPLRVPESAAFTGVEVFAQAFWKSPCLPLLSASNALSVTVQP